MQSVQALMEVCSLCTIVLSFLRIVVADVFLLLLLLAVV